MKKKNVVLLVIALVVAFSFALVGCNNREVESEADKVTVRFMDGTTVLKTEKIKKSEKVTEYAPTKTDYEFMGWFASPTKTHKFDFTKAITENTDIFSGFSKFQADTREFNVLGSGTSNLLSKSSWGKVIGAEHKLTKDATKNEYSIAMDVLEGDEFQFALNAEWHNKRGFGYMAKTNLDDGVAAFEKSGGGLGEVGAKGANIKVLKEGRYTFKLTTYPLDDTYDTNNAAYDEKKKEVFNLGTYDKITWERTGEVVDRPVIVTKYHVKGSGISNWLDSFNSRNTLTAIKDGDKETTKVGVEIFLKAEEEFMIISSFTQAGKVTAGNLFVRGNALDEASKALFTVNASANMITKEAGTYKFTYDTATKVLSATLDKTKVLAERDFYLDGNFMGEWGDSMYGKKDDRKPGLQPDSNLFLTTTKYKFVEKLLNNVGTGKFEIKGVDLEAGKELLIQSFKKGSTEPGKWGTDGYNALGGFNSGFLDVEAAKVASPASATNANIKVVTAGKYDIQIDAYSGLISITASVVA